MEDRGLIGYNDRPQGTVSAILKILKTVRRHTWGKYLQMLLMASNPLGVTMNEISSQLGEKPQTMHPLLIRMMERGAITREKRNTEYYYHLAPGFLKEEIESLIKTIADENSLNAATLLDLDDDKSFVERQFDENQDNYPSEEAKVATVNIQETPNESDRELVVSRSMEWDEKMIQLRVSRLPEFNPEWSESVRQAWYEALDRAAPLKHRGL